MELGNSLPFTIKSHLNFMNVLDSIKIKHKAATLFIISTCTFQRVKDIFLMILMEVEKQYEGSGETKQDCTIL